LEVGAIDACRATIGSSKAVRVLMRAPSVCVAESTVALVRFSWLSHLGIKSAGASASIRQALDALTVSNIAGFAFLPTVYVSCVVIVPFVEMLTGRFRHDLYYIVLLVTICVIIVVAIQLEVLDDILTFDEVGDSTILIAGVISWFRIRAAALNKPQPIELGILTAVHVLLGGALYSQDPLLGAFIIILIAALFIFEGSLAELLRF